MLGLIPVCSPASTYGRSTLVFFGNFGWLGAHEVDEIVCEVCGRVRAPVVVFADSSTQLLIGPKDAHCFELVERSAFILPAADGHGADPFALGIF